MYVIAKETKLGFKYLQNELTQDNTPYFTYDLRDAIKYNSEILAVAQIETYKDKLKKYKVFKTK